MLSDDKWKQFIIWMLSIVAIAAFVGFVIVEDSPVSKGRSVSGRAATHRTTTTQAPAEVTSTSEQSSAKKTTKTTSTSSPRSRTGKTVTMQAHEVFSLVESNPESIASITFYNGSERITLKKVDDTTRYYSILPEGGGKQALIDLARAKNVVWTAQSDSTAALRGFFFSFGPFLLIGGVILFIYMRNRKAGAGGPGMSKFGKSKAKDHDEEGAEVRRVTFDDVAGCDEAIKELRRIARGLKLRRLYSFFGAKVPKGVILEGPPGTGKTLLARAVAGETDGSFASTSGSDFVEMFVGVGASRVRDMFEQGRAKVKKTGKPHIIFIDEIDAVGGKRGGGTGQSSNDEREQTLNAILVEMDGMKNNEGLIIIAATNRVDMLDEALLRPGRFDSQVLVEKPNTEGRAKIFAIHTRNKPLADGVDCNLLAARSFGYSGAEIEGACNRAAILSAERYGTDIPEDATDAQIEAALREARAAITLADFDEGIDFVRYGSADPGKQKAMAEEEKRNTAVHEAGHACATDVMPGAYPVVKITIMNRSKALGYVQQMPGDDTYSQDVVHLISRMVTAMAGRAAQEVILGKSDTGASNDFEQACQIAHGMVTRFGMSRLGHISVGRGGTAMRGIASGPVSNYGPKLADAIDEEWMRIVEECYKIARTIIEKDRARIEKLSDMLLENETVLGEEWKTFKTENPSNVNAKELAFDPASKEGE